MILHIDCARSSLCHIALFIYLYYICGLVYNSFICFIKTHIHYPKNSKTMKNFCEMKMFSYFSKTQSTAFFKKK